MAKRDKTLPVRAVCRNCGTHTVGPYCHICGQELLAGTTHRLREILGDSLGTIWAWDGKVPRTLWYLVAFPGRLTKEFYDGRIVRYVYPSKLFWFTTIIFFALLLSDAKTRETDGAAPATTTAAATEQKTLVSPVAGSGAGAVEDAVADGDKSTIFGNEVDPSELKGYLAIYAPYIILLLVPVFALLTMLFFWRRERSYSDYLVFSLHFTTFVYLLFSAVLVVGKIFPKTADAAWLLPLLPAIYLGAALRRVWRPRIIPMVFKILMMGFIYFIVIAVVAIIFLIFFVFFIKKIDTFA